MWRSYPLTLSKGLERAAILDQLGSAGPALGDKAVGFFVAFLGYLWGQQESRPLLVNSLWVLYLHLNMV